MTALLEPTAESHRKEPEAPAPKITKPTVERLALAALLVGTAVLYLWGLGQSGWANSFYAAAAQAGSESWKAFFFGSSDAANSITVDKTPLSIWPMAISIRLFGLSSWSMLIPQALIGVGSVALLYATVKRTTANAWAGLSAGLVLALTPVAVLMFRFNNPDALLVLFLIGSVYATLRAIENPRRAVAWLAFGGALVGLAFLTKMMQAFLVLPALMTGYLICAKVQWPKRLVHLLIAFGSMILAAGWWVALVELWPTESRPYIGGSQNNSILELTLGYNGFGRLSGNETGSVGGGGGWGTPGLGRLFNAEIGGQIAWFAPAAMTLLVVGFWLCRGRGRTDRARAALVIWGGWLLVTAATFSFMGGIFHAYYTVALAPAIAAVIGVGGWLMYENWDRQIVHLVAGFTVSITSATAFILLNRSAGFLPWLSWLILIVGIVSATFISLSAVLSKRAQIAVAIAAAITVLAGPAAFALATASTPHTGSIPTAGPSSGSGPGGGRTMGAPPGRAGNGTGTGTDNGTGAGAGGLLSGSQSSSQIDELLLTDAESFTWVAAAIGSNTAAGFQLSTEKPVMAIGGFNGSDPSPTLAQFQELVNDEQIHWFIGSSGRGGPSPSGSTSTEIAEWVSANFESKTVDGVTLYDLTEQVQK
ncbi:MAG TPA: glycosyltransferase family 39 protein [Aeromicrobium sp.]|nr:glycosyltransferase family 39 protein [Aeromicrobium sp.]